MDRKEKVKILGKHLGIKPKYLGAPSFAYKVGDFKMCIRDSQQHPQFP